MPPAHVTVRRSRVGRLWDFVIQVFPPHVNLTYGVLWAGAYEVAASSAGWRPSWATVIRALTVVLMLFYLRIVDEQKDLEYDRLHNPSRPLVTGVVSERDLDQAMRLIVTVILAGNVFLSGLSTVVLLAFLGYTALLTEIENRWAGLRRRPLLHLAVVYPVQLLIGFYLYTSLAEAGSLQSYSRSLLLLLTFAVSFLHWEIARKTFRLPVPGVRTYSLSRLGPTGSGAVALLSATLACVLAMLALQPWNEQGLTRLLAWAPGGALIFAVVGGVQFLSRRKDHWPVASAVLFLLTLYILLIAQIFAKMNGY
ncbi:hypothetical protein JCM4814A_02540 [Streptomyces phaeofaciens JCM 4814]|uniref:Prenyltransferase n=1 Tax=Streptomyces phaeofaciens TaxID=68254 RepID=A0A918HQ76_9ACTN|nr:hypothetical protein [Streptomyces phaeofaciens]GGT93086.1 hypothetical protein GCM10010226_83700 [Streptomyces phaeofaciens]